METTNSVQNCKETKHRSKVSKLNTHRVHGKKSHGNGFDDAWGFLLSAYYCILLFPRSLFQTAQSAYRQRRLSCGFKYQCFVLKERLDDWRGYKVRPHRTRSAAADCGLCPLRNVTF